MDEKTEKRRVVSAARRLGRALTGAGVRLHGIFRSPGGTKGSPRRDPYEGFEVIERVLSPDTCRILYEQFWPAANVADTFSEDIVRGWFTLDFPDRPDLAQIVERYLLRLNAKSHFHSMALNEAIYGDGGIALGIQDGRMLHEPVDESNIEKIEFLHSFGRTAISSMELEGSLFSPQYGRIKKFILNSDKQSSLKVDASRILHFQTRGMERDVWGRSLFLRMLQIFLVIDNAEWTVGQLIYSLVFRTLKSNWEFDNEEQEQIAQQELEKELNVLTTFLLGEGEKIEYVGPTGAISGLEPLLKYIWECYAASARIPQSHLLGQPQGTVTGAAWDTRRYYDRIRGIQENYLRELIERLIRYILLAKDGGGLTPEEVNTLTWGIRFNSLLEEEETEKVKRDLVKAQTAQALIETGIAEAGELRGRFDFLNGSETPLEKLVQPENAGENRTDV